ncbi:MAG: TetR/AcrR family transcriptional regulator [Microthrixaceae bacterium]
MTTVISGGQTDPDEPGRHDDALASRLVDAAIDCIDQLGLGRLTTAEVALRAGVTQTEQYRLFPVRADLLGAVAAEVLRRWADDIAHPRSGTVIDLSAGPREAWRSVGSPRRQDRLSAETHVWQELVLASYTDPHLAERMRELGGAIAQVALAELRQLPGAELVPDDVLLGVGVTVMQMRETGRTYLQLNGYEIPGLTKALQLMLEGVCDRYGIGSPAEPQPAVSEAVD